MPTTEPKLSQFKNIISSEPELRKNTNTNLMELILQRLREKSRTELLDLSAVLKELEIREKENLAEKYIPNGKCEEFIRLVGSNRCFVNLFSAANGVGKTAAGVNIITNLCFGIQNNFFKNLPLFENFPYLKKGRIISDPTTIKEKIVPELKKWFPSNRFKIHYETSKDGKQYERKWTTDTGWEFDLMTTEQGAKEFESVDLGWIWIDEPCPSYIYRASIARTRKGAIIFWTMTPLDYAAWVDDKIVSKRDGVNSDYITADVEDNCLTHGSRGILDHGNIERMIAQWPEAEKEARAHGKFGHILGRIHKLFDRKIHIINPFKITYEDFCVYEALDTHPRVNEAVLWIAVDRNNQKYLIDEIWAKPTIPELAQIIKAKTAGWRIVKRIIDPSAFNEDDRIRNNKTIASEFVDCGLYYEPGSKDIVSGIRITNDALNYTKQEEEILRMPEISFFKNVERTIWEIERGYVWDNWCGKGAEDKDPKPKPKDKNDHMMENLHRLLLLNPKFIEISEQNQIIESPIVDFN